ncbi:MAG TPA: hypothetical protein VMZ52_15245 [Bryobacteraceae bacterium]|nr:hypothetical protein [Bryobacteraceae bacterium]
MIYNRRSTYANSPGGFHRFQNAAKNTMYGFGEGDYIRLRDEFGTVWRGMAEREDDHQVRYRFRDEKGRSISGLSDSHGIVLRDEKGQTWRGFVD